MIEKEILLKIKQIVFEILKIEGTGHDFYHIQRVVNTTQKIATHENCDLSYATLLAYLHDVGDYKLHKGEDRTSEMIHEILVPLNFNHNLIQKIVQDVHLIGYKGGFNEKPTDIEVQIVQDADRLDAMGAIGIARAFAYGGSKGRMLHIPNYKSKAYDNMEDYKKSEAPTIQHFYDKLLKLKDLMNTATAKKLAEERHMYMEGFLEQFYDEWDGKR